MKIFTIFKCLIRFLNLLFTILKFLVDMMSVMLRKFPLTEWSIMTEQRQKPALLRCFAIRRGLCRCSASLTSVSLHGCLVFLRCEAVLLATMILITEYGWLKMLSLSVNMWRFTDKYFKINNLSVRGRVFTDKITFREATINRNSRGAHKKMRCVTRNEANTALNWIEQPACRNLAYGTECQVDMTSSKMQVMWKSG